MAFGVGFEIGSGQWQSLQVDPARTGHVRDHADGHAGQAIGGAEQVVAVFGIVKAALVEQLLHQGIVSGDGICAVLERAVAGQPA